MIGKAALLLVLVQLVACGGDGGSSTPPPAPSGLSYPTPPSYTVGVAITALTPTVTGTVTSYAVSPGLPAGLALNASSGVISGTPSAVSPASTYTVTASNSTGSSTADVSITVGAAVAAPMVSYPNLAYTLTAGTAANIAAVSTGGAVATWTVTPALPAGLAFNTATGSIAGIPTAVSLPASYVVSAENSGGKYKVGVTLQVVSKVLIDLGHNASISQLVLSGTRLLSQAGLATIDEGAVYRCNLWNTSTDTLVTALQCTGQIALAGSTAVIVGPTPSCQRTRGSSRIDGYPGGKDHDALLLVAARLGWQLHRPRQRDWAQRLLADRTEFVFRGRQLRRSKRVRRPRSNSDRARLRRGECYSNRDNCRRNSKTWPAFMGTFNEWFSDGSHYQTTVGTSVFTYTSASVQVDLTSLTTVQGLGGEGNYFWTFGAGFSGLSIYMVGSVQLPR